MINQVKSPLKYSPANNPIIFGFSGDSPNLVLFQTQLVEDTTQSVIYTGNIFPPPLSNKANINLSKQLSALVRSDVDNAYGTIVTGKTRNTIGYRMNVSEYGYSSAGTLSLISTATTNTYYAFEAGLDISNYTNSYTSTSHLMSSAGTGSFLTFQPNNKAVNAFSNEQLYFLQDGYSALTVNINAKGSNRTFGVSANTGNTYVISPAVPATKASAHIVFTGSSSGAGDNISVFVSGSTLLGAYTASTSAVTATLLAAGLQASIDLNALGYTTTRNNADITIIAPSGGTAGNSITLTTAIGNTATTFTSATASTSASVLILGYTLPPLGAEVNIDTTDPTYGYISLANYFVDSSDTTLSAFTTHLVAAINAGGYGYTASLSTSSRFTITARSGTGSIMNGVTVGVYSPYFTIYSDFAGGMDAGGSSGFTQFHSLLPHYKTSFTGGTDAIAQVTGVRLPFMVRVATSPRSLITQGITGLSKGDTYIVTVKTNSTGTTLSEARTYVYDDTGCNVDLMNVMFTNSLGGVDSIQMVAPQESVSVNKQTIKKNELDTDNVTPYVTNGVFNVSDMTYASTPKVTIKAYTKPLSDEESKYLVELVNSKNIYLELTNGQLLPVQLKTTNYSIQKKRYINRELIQYQFEFSLPDNFLPSLSSASYIIN